MRILAINANTTESITAPARAAASEADRQPAGRLRRTTARANA